MEDINVCSICGKEYRGFGNNAEPINNGRCCNQCNRDIVLTERLRIIRENSTHIPRID